MEFNDMWGSGAGAMTIDWSKASTIYASVRGLLYVSTNRGESWIKAGAGLPQSVRIKQLVLDPKNSSTLYVVGTRGLWRRLRP